MKQMKRILAAVLTVTMMLGMVPFTGLAANNYTVDLYWGKFLGFNTDGTPIYAGVGEDGLQNHMWDEVGQDIHAVFLFWNGKEFEEVPVGELTFPTNLNWEISDRYSNAVYMNFDTALKDVITYEKDNVTYSFELEVVDLSLDGPLSYHNACERSTDTWLPMGREGEILYGTHGTPDTAWLMWDTAVVGTVTGVTVYFQDVYGAGVVLNGQSLTDAASALASYNITLTPALDQGYIRVDTDFNRAYNLILTLTNSNGDSYSRHLNIDERNINIGGTLPDAAFFDEMDRSTDAWLSKEIVQGAAGETRTFWFMWNPDRFTVTKKDDIKVYFERNEEEGIELLATVWDDSVDDFLDDNDYTLELDLDNNCVKITATFDRTVDFYMYLTDKDGNQVEAQLNIDEEDSSVGLYWVKLQGVTDGKPVYDTSRAAQSMTDIVGEEITAVFLFWDGEAYSEVPYDELNIPDEVSYEQSAEYANAVHMVFENALEDDITYTVDGKTYRFPLKVEAAPELEKGLYWSEFEGLDEEGQPSYSTDANDLDNAMEDVLGQDISAIFLFWTGSEFVEVPVSELSFPAGLTYQVNAKHANAVDMVFDKVLKGDITYTVDDTTYRFNLTVDLPLLGLYTDPAGGETAYAGNEVTFDGKDDEGITIDTEAWYLRFSDGRTITSVSVPTSFITAEISSDGSYATITVSEGFESGESYRLEATYVRSDGEERSARCRFTVNDERPGLKWCSVDNPNDILTPETNNLRSSMNFGAVLGNSTWAAFYFVDGENKTQLMLNDLTWDGLVAFELLEENGVEKDGFFRVRFKAYGSGYISYEKDDVTYKLPVTLDLPPVAFYSAPERTEDNCVGQELVFDGQDESGKAVTEETFYLMLEEGWKVTGIEFENGQPDFFSYEIVDNYAVVTIGEDFDDNWYNATVYTESITDANQTDWWGIGLEIRDERPGLKWCWGGSVEDVDNGNYDDLESSMDMNISGSNSSYDIAFYFVDGETVTKLGRDADLDFDDFGKATWNNESSAYDVQFLKFGKHKIVYTDESGAQYSLSVAVTLPDFAFYSEPEASEEAYLSDALILRGDPTTVYLVCRQPWLTITDLELDVWDNDDDMSFLKWTLSPDGSYITMEIGKAVRADHRYSLAVYYQKDNGGTDDYRMSFEVQKKDPSLIWFPAEADGAGGYTVLDKTVHRSSMTMAPGDSILLQLQYFDSANYITPDVDKLTLPDFLEVEVLDAEEAILRVTCKSLGVGAITCTDWSTYSIRVTVQAAGALDFYTQPERSSAYLDRNFNGEDGEVITRYLMWDQTLLPGVDKVTVSLNDGSTGSYVLVDADVTTADLSPWGIVLTPALEQGYVKVEATLSLWRNVKFALWQGSDIGAETVVNIDEDYDEWGDDREGSDNLVFDWNSSAGTVELTIGMGEIEWRGGVAAIGVRGGGYNHFTGEGDMNHQICIGALVNQGTDGEGEAPKAVYDAISNVRFFVSRWMNKDASGDQTKSNISVSEVYTTEFNGKTVYAADLTSEVGGYAYVEVCASFTVTLDGVTRECTVYHRFGTEPKTDFEINMSELDTAEKLNAVLASTEALEAWLQENEPEALNGFYEALQRGDFANLHLNLPPVKYDGIIEYGITGLEGPDLQGTEDEEGNRTTMPGLWLRGNDSFFLDDIDFVADERYKMTMGEESFTCGILSWGVGTGAAKRGDIYSAQGCTFTGLDYGIRCTPTGYTVMQHNVFIDCGVGYLLDCEGKNGGNANSTLGDNRFVGCDVGVWVRNLPDYITPYDFRVYNNDFINNLVDIDASQHGRLYFYKNYFGYTADGSAPENWEDVSVRHARVRGRGYATVIVNPRWRYAVTLGAPDNYLYLDTWHGLFNYMTAEEAGELTVSAADLDSDLTAAEEPVEINITDQEENDLGTWTFPNGETAAVATYSLRRTVPTDFCAALAFGTDENGNVTVTVQHSSILASRVPTLSVPVDFATAKVLYDYKELPGVTVSGGKVIFPVAAGGTYTIIGTDQEADYVPSESAGGSETTDVGAWYDYSDAEEPESFVQIGTETVKEVMQADPDEDLGEALDQIVETEIITVEAVYKAPEENDVVVLLVLYDANGKMIAMHQQAATEEVNFITVTCDKELVTTNAVTVKAFIVAADGTMSPLATVPFSTELTIPKN